MDTKAVSRILQSVKSLPALPAAVQRVVQLSDDTETSGNDIARIISTDQALTSQLLRVANSAFYGLSQRVPTVAQAIMVLGLGAIKSLALGVSVFGFQAKPGSKAPLDREQFWKHSLSVAIAARFLALRIRLRCPEEAFTAGLLHDIGKVILMEQFPDIYAEILSRSGPARALWELEREAFKLDHAQLGVELCEHWKLPPALCRVVADHHQPNLPYNAENRMTRLIQAADNLAKLAQLGDGGDRRIDPEFAATLRRDGLETEQLRQILLAFPGELQKAEQFFNLTSTPSPKLRGHTPLPAIGVFIADDKLREVVSMALLYQGYALFSSPVSDKDDPPLVGVIAADTMPAWLAERVQQEQLPFLDAATWRKEASGSVPIDVVCRWCGTLVPKEET